MCHIFGSFCVIHLTNKKNTQRGSGLQLDNFRPVNDSYHINDHVSQAITHLKLDKFSFFCSYLFQPYWPWDIEWLSYLFYDRPVFIYPLYEMPIVSVKALANRKGKNVLFPCEEFSTAKSLESQQHKQVFPVWWWLLQRNGKPINCRNKILNPNAKCEQIHL